MSLFESHQGILFSLFLNYMCGNKCTSLMRMLLRIPLSLWLSNLGRASPVAQLPAPLASLLCCPERLCHLVANGGITAPCSSSFPDPASPDALHVLSLFPNVLHQVMQRQQPWVIKTYVIFVASKWAKTYNSACRSYTNSNRGGLVLNIYDEKEGRKGNSWGIMNGIGPEDYVALKFKRQVRVLYALLSTTGGRYPSCTTDWLWASYFSSPWCPHQQCGDRNIYPAQFFWKVNKMPSLVTSRQEVTSHCFNYSYYRDGSKCQNLFC